MSGLAPDEATDLTAFLCGLPIGSTPWRLREVNALLFLRELHRAGRFAVDAEPPGGGAIEGPGRGSSLLS